jgi:hypothetical protein
MQQVSDGVKPGRVIGLIGNPDEQVLEECCAPVNCGKWWGCVKRCEHCRRLALGDISFAE